MLKDLKFLIKIIPFCVTSIYLLYMGIIFFQIPEEVISFIDLAVYAGPTYAIPFIALSIKSGFCMWHRTAIIIPQIAVFSGIMEGYFRGIGIWFHYTNISALIILSVLTIFCGIKVLWKKG